MFIKTSQRIERILLNDVVDRCVRASKLAVGGGVVTYGAWRGLDFTKCGAAVISCVMFAGLSTLLGMIALFTLSGGDEGG